MLGTVLTMACKLDTAAPSWSLTPGIVSKYMDAYLSVLCMLFSMISFACKPLLLNSLSHLLPGAFQFNWAKLTLMPS